MFTVELLIVTILQHSCCYGNQAVRCVCVREREHHEKCDGATSFLVKICNMWRLNPKLTSTSKLPSGGSTNAAVDNLT